MRYMLAIAATGVLFVPCEAQEVLFEAPDIAGALFLQDGAVAVADAAEQRLHFVDSQGSVATHGHRFGDMQLTGRLSGHVVIWDATAYSAVVVASANAAARVVSFPEPGLRDGQSRLVALLPGDIGILELADPGNPFAQIPEGRHRSTARYVAFPPDEPSYRIAQARGKESAFVRTDGAIASGPVVFGYDVFVAQIDGFGIIVAESDASTASVVGTRGELEAVPLPPRGTPVSQEQIEQERSRLLLQHDAGPVRDLLATILPKDQIERMAERITADSYRTVQAAPGNTMPPRISDLRVDRNGRVWMRRFALGGGTTAVWDVHSLENGNRQTTALPASWVVFDAADDRVLAGVRSETGQVVRVVIANSGNGLDP